MIRKGTRSDRVPTEEKIGDQACVRITATDFPAAQRAKVELRPRPILAVAAVHQPSASGSVPPRASICGRLDKIPNGAADNLKLLRVTYSLGRCRYG